MTFLSWYQFLGLMLRNNRKPLAQPFQLPPLPDIIFPTPTSKVRTATEAWINARKDLQQISLLPVTLCCECDHRPLPASELWTHWGPQLLSTHPTSTPSLVPHFLNMQSAAIKQNNISLQSSPSSCRNLTREKEIKIPPTQGNNLTS